MSMTSPFLSLFGAGVRDSLSGLYHMFQLDDFPDVKGSPDKPIRQSVLSNRRAKEQQNVASSTEKKMGGGILIRILKCCSLNGGVFLASYFCIYFFILPSLSTFLLSGVGLSEGTVSRIETWLSVVTAVFWVIPLFLLIKVVNVIWFQELADQVYTVTQGKAKTQGISETISDTVFSLLVQTLFLLQGVVVGYLPPNLLRYLIVGLHFTLLYSLYAFEYKWCNMGWGVHRRVSHIECLWPYYVGFGLPMTIMTEMCSTLAGSGGMFAFLFPLFIISACKASPEDESRYQFSQPLRLFNPSTRLPDYIFTHLFSEQPTNEKKNSSK